MFTDIITTTEVINANEWYFIALRWKLNGNTLECTLILNNKIYTKSVTEFKDFTGSQTAVGSNPYGNYTLNGLIKNFSYSPLALSNNEMLAMYYNSRVNYEYDTLGRLTKKTINAGANSYETSYSYVPGNVTGATTSKLSSISNNGIEVEYKYDVNGNITKIIEGGRENLYYYNELNELIQEDIDNLSKSILYSYDLGGNIIGKTEIVYGNGESRSSIIYEYDSIWKDKLKSYNGKPITYDQIGNSLTYDGYTYTWEEGRRLKSIVGNGQNISYKYNDVGIRTEKNVNGVITKYYLSGDKVILEDNGTDKLYYSYDSFNNLISMNLNGEEYYYIRNGQGDIIGLFDSSGTEVVKYYYDSWGKLISIEGTAKDTVGVKNSYRYRGYRYDNETGLYYLQSRYYNPDWGRFINADGLVGTPGEFLSANMFAYCANNPVNREDPSGYLWGFIKEFAAQVSSAINTLKPVYVVSGGLAMGDGPSPIGDLIGAAIVVVVTVGAVGYATYKAVTKTKTKSITNVQTHGNSKLSKRPQHGYEIYNRSTGDVVKVGISSGKIRLDGKSYRAERQVRAFNNIEKGEIYASRIMEYFPNRQSALSWEWLNSQYHYAQGHSMRYHSRPAFDNWYWDVK